MQKYFDNVDDYHDATRSRLLIWVEWLLPRVIAVGAILVVLGVCASLEAI